MSELGAMQDWPLLTWRLIDHAAQNHGSREIVSLLVEGGEHRTNWREVRDRALKVAQSLARLGIVHGDRVATLAWNTHRYVECWYGISGMGAVAHTINPRLFADQIVYIANHAQDRVLFLDLSFVGLVEQLAPRLTSIEHFIVMTDAAHLPASTLPLIAYEDLIDASDGDYDWADLDERAPAGLCYTSGTTGNPKGVLYSHRSNLLHSFAAVSGDALGIVARTVVMPVVPMYHANAWGVPYAAAQVGAKMVMAGPHFDPPTLQRLIVAEGVDLTLAVPTVWLGMLQHLEETGLDLGRLKRVVIGGSAAPRAMIQAFQRNHDVAVSHAWGMTEMSPLGTVGSPCARFEGLPEERRLDLQCKQGRAIFGVEMKIVGEDGVELPRDGIAFGRLLVRGPWVVAAYFRGDGGDVLDADGWFDTGDVATLDAYGYMTITDRAKDVIKSGGEWISSIELENAAVGAPGVLEAAVIGIYHPKWDERPLLLVRAKPGAVVSKTEVLDYLRPRIAKWWTPDEVLVVDDLPHTATGKLLKTELRTRYKDYVLPTA
ncbi:long-chain-fatty-acid--CoA ligase [Glacieibacterium sp.]|uniref:long-chain-fatty-acid--CoA ligase n=1 Tax=Glacieibacterium sp. TaxID=2860237 RepID=UPI003AFF86C3